MSVWPIILALPRSNSQRRDNNEADAGEGVEESPANRPSNSFYDHLMNNLKNSNQFVELASKPQGIPPPLDDDYDDDQPPVPIFNYAFINPALNGEKTPHWTETLESFKQNPAISPDVKDKVVQSLHNPIKIYGDGTESRFPLLMEYFVQRIQNYFSHYVYEDMSRPASWDVKANATDHKPVSSEKEPVTEGVAEGGKVELTSATQLNGANGTIGEDYDDVEYIVDITLSPNMDERDRLDVELTDEDFEKTTEEWETPKVHLPSTTKIPSTPPPSNDYSATEFNLTASVDNNSEQKVVIEKETIDLKLIVPIELEDNAFIYVGEGTGEELLRHNNNKRKKIKKKKSDKKKRN